MTEQTTTWDTALDLYTLDGVTDVNRVQDSNGELTFVQIDFTDGTILVAGDEHDDGEIIGWTGSLYADPDDIEGIEPLDTDGSDDHADLADWVRRLAR